MYPNQRWGCTRVSSKTTRIGERFLDITPNSAKDNLGYVIIGIPVALLVVFFLIPTLYLFATTFFPREGSGYYQIGFTLEHYARLFDSPIYGRYLWTTLELAAVTTVISVVLGYPIAYWLARVESPALKRGLLLMIVATMWITVIIRAYAIQVVLAGDGILNSLLLDFRLISEPITSSTGYIPTIVGMVYGFLPFAILTIYTSIANINPKLEEASRNLGASRLQTIRWVVLPLSKNGIAGATALVFILAIGSYVVPMLLGNPSEWTLPVIITEQVNEQMNVPFGAVLSAVLTALTIFFFLIAVKVLGLGSDQLIGDTPEGETDGQ